MVENAISTTIQTTMSELADAIQEVASSDEEAFAVLEVMLVEGRISVRSGGQISVEPMHAERAA